MQKSERAQPLMSESERVLAERASDPEFVELSYDRESKKKRVERERAKR